MVREFKTAGLSSQAYSSLIHAKPPEILG